jgi:hypothetical protein
LIADNNKNEHIIRRSKMINSEVKNAIETIVKLDVIGEEFPHKELDLAIVNCDYYVRPGVARTAFMFWFHRIMDGEFPAELLDRNIPNEMRIPMTLAGLVRTFFDKSYFEEFCNIPVAAANCSTVKKIMKKFSTKELKNFFILLINGRGRGDMFISNSGSTSMWKRINDECRNVDNSIPEITEMSTAYSAFTENNPIYFFDYLTPKTIVDIISDNIDKNTDIAEKLARLLRDSGYSEAKRYLDNIINRQKH